MEGREERKKEGTKRNRGRREQEMREGCRGNGRKEGTEDGRKGRDGVKDGQIKK